MMDMVWTLLPYWGLATQAPHWHEPRIGAIFRARVYSRRDLPPADVDTLALIRRERQSFLSLQGGSRLHRILRFVDACPSERRGQGVESAKPPRRRTVTTRTLRSKRWTIPMNPALTIRERARTF